MSEETKDGAKGAEEPKKSNKKAEKVEKVEKQAPKKIKATPVYKNGYIEPASGKDIPVNRDDILEGRYLKIEKIKVIVGDKSGQNKESFTTIVPQTVKLDGYEGEYLDLKCSRYVECKGMCDEEIEINQYVYNSLRGSTRPAHKRIKQGSEGAYTDVAIKARNWSLETID